MFELILHPFAVAISWVWVGIHKGLVILGMTDGSGLAWVLSIILVTIVVRTLIIPLYLKQIHSSRGMQALQPEIKKLQAKYKGKTDPASRQRMIEEQQALYKKHGASPFSSCLPLLVQMPILFAIYRVFYNVKYITDGTYTYRGEPATHLGPIDKTLATEIDHSTVAGVHLSATLGTAGNISAIAVFVVLILAMVVLQFWSMRMMLVRNMPPQDDPNNPMVRSQKMMMYMMPAMFIMTGLVFQMGVLIYMVTGTVWALLQQIWVLKAMPTPGSPAYVELLEKRQESYQSWAREFFTDYEGKRALAGSDEDAIAQLNSETLTDVKARGKKSGIVTNFPTQMSDGEVLTIYRHLAIQTWTTLPDELWMKGIHRQAEVSAERREQAQLREQPRRRTKAQRLAQNADSRAEAAAQESTLSSEELERRRQERRKAERERRKKNR